MKNDNQAENSSHEKLLVKLLEMDLEQECKIKKLEKEFELACRGLQTGLLLDTILDFIGVPEDNTVETNACEIANATGEWPRGSYCRDYFYSTWCEIKNGESKTKAADFIAWARKQI